ncbi:MAG: hypothetical protein IH914_03815, partial [candidate division Zixibacteria bacterium]|nr:hypothetical protein [candidate division Zixibacteria bacterium]
MSNKLLTGALTLSILLMSSATVYSAVPDQRVPVLDPSENPNAPLFGQEDAQLIAQPPADGFRRIANTEFVDPTGIDLTRNSVPTFVCSETFNLGSITAGFSFRNVGLDVGVIVEYVGNRIDVEKGFLCSLTGSWYLVFNVEGDIDGEFSVWTGSGGIPTTKVASQIINSTALVDHAYNFIDWSSFGLTFTDDFYLVFGSVIGSAVDAGGPNTDRIQMIGDANDPGQPPRVGVTNSTEVGGWFQNSTFWITDYNFGIDAVVCCEEIPFTNCILNTHADSRTFIFGLPSGTNCRKGFAVRYETGGFDTLLNAEISLSDLAVGIAPDGEVVIELLGDDGTGVPDPSNSLVAPITVGGPGLGAALYPLGTEGWIDYPLGGLVLPPGTKYHITCRWTGPSFNATGQRTVMRADDFRVDFGNEGDPELFSSVYFPGSLADPAYPLCAPIPAPGWHNYFATFGIKPDFIMEVFTCRDEFIDCELVTDYLAVVFRSDFFEDEPFPQAFGSFAAGGDECRIQTIRSHTRGWAAISGLLISIFDDAGGVPGVELFSEFVDSSQFLLPEGNPSVHGLASTVDIFPNGGLGFYVVGPYHIVLTPGYDILDANPDGFYSYRLDDGRAGSGATDQSGMSFQVPGNWFTISDIFGGPFNIAIDNFRCCIPFNERVCDPGEDWPTYQHDQARTGASLNALGDANCNLNRVWSANSDLSNGFSGSVIAGNIVYISDDGGFDARNLGTGALIWDQTFDPTVKAAFSLATGVRTQLTVAFVRADTATGGTWPGGLMTFLGTGLNKSVVAVDALTGAHVWTNKTGNPFPGLHPNTNNIKCIVYDDGVGADIVIYAAGPKVYAVIAQTGLPCPFWPAAGAGNPFVMGNDNINAISTDNLGAGDGQIYIPTFSGAVTANVHALNRFTGAEIWNLQTVVGSPFLASDG